jgi:hypothetical protein
MNPRENGTYKEVMKTMHLSQAALYVALPAKQPHSGAFA